MDKVKENFRYYYSLEAENDRNPCGPGSDASLVTKAGTIDFIADVIRRYKISSISDCACGLFENWMCLVDLSNADYTGYDINDIAIGRNRKQFPDMNFIECDISEYPISKSDLIICRDCLFHLPNDYVTRILDNFRKSGSTYLLSTEHRDVTANSELCTSELKRGAGFRFVNLEIAPYNMGPPVEYHTEVMWKDDEQGQNRHLAIWRL